MSNPSQKELIRNYTGNDRKLFVDTWGWIVIHNKREPRHSEVSAFIRKFRAQGGSLYTTDYVLDETFTLLFRRLPILLAVNTIKVLDKAIEQGYLNLEIISPTRFEKAKSLRLKFKDKPTISFTDLVSIAVMKDLDIESILTADDHFVQVGMGFKKVP